MGTKKQKDQKIMEQAILNHNLAVNHLELAVKYHFDAARYFENGDIDKAIECNAKAQDSTNKAVECNSKIENKN
ncbi:hypothetical protein [Myroides odoratus]|uniref:hypothetical protein n=1 Tax=Myroides odoratus TaxID=256 RepID=UPI0039B0AE72